MARIAIAGATGFVGSALIGALAEDHSILALTRGAVSPSLQDGNEDVQWKKCDLFSLLQTEDALVDIDIAIYLVHSMLPSAELSQGSFQDWDLLAADNFRRACEKNGVGQIVYLGGIIPRDADLSPHLESRLEVEQVLRDSVIPLTAFRAAIIIGAGSSSLTIMERLVRRLPVMLCPKWTATKSRPISITDVVNAVSASIANKEAFDRIFDLGGPESLNYRELMLAVADCLDLRRLVFPVPVVTPKFSRLWVAAVTRAPINLVAPLIESLRHEMLPSKMNRFDLEVPPPQALKDALLSALSAQAGGLVKPRAFELPPDERQIHFVQSVQRLPKPDLMDAPGVALEYQAWLPKHLWPFLNVKNVDNICEFRFRFFPRPLLVLRRADERSFEGRVLFYIVGGMLSGTQPNGRLEFREACGGKHILAAVHDFQPALPWFIYKYTQALAHLWVMSSFRKHLERLQPKEANS